MRNREAVVFKHSELVKAETIVALTHNPLHVISVAYLIPLISEMLVYQLF